MNTRVPNKNEKKEKKKSKTVEILCNFTLVFSRWNKIYEAVTYLSCL